MSKDKSVIEAPSESEQSWIRKQALSILRLEGESVVVDVDEKVERRTCLGNSISYLSDGLTLGLAGFREPAHNRLQLAKVLSLRAHDQNETYIYEDIDGRNSFARYVATRTARTSGWLLEDPEEEVARNWKLSLDYLGECVRTVRNTSEISLGRFMLHLAQAGDWSALLERTQQPTTAAKGTWREARKNLNSLARWMLRDESMSSYGEFEAWFLSRFLVVGPVRSLASDVTLDDAFCFAEVRARWLYAVDEPWRTLRSLVSRGAFGGEERESSG